MGPFAGLLGNSILQQIVLYQVVGALIGAALSPYLQALTNQVNQVSPLAPLSPQVAAEAVRRELWTEGQAAHEASFSGINAERQAILNRLSGSGPDAGSLAVALRRKLIDQGRYLEGVRQSGLRGEWAQLVQQLSMQDPSPTAPLQALLMGQLPEGTARELFQRFGGNPEHFDWLYDTEGTAPTPTQALELANRGIIPWGGSGAGVVSYEQAFLEGPWRNKWLGPFQALGEYLPPPRTVTAMYREGSISRAKAAELLTKQGLAADMVEAYLVSGSSQATDKTRQLAQATIIDLYEGRMIARQVAQDMLEGLRYDREDAEFILDVADARLAERFLSSAIGRIRTLYTGHKISQAQAESVLAQLEVPAEGIGDLVAIWSYERAANVTQLTAAQVAGAFRDKLIDQVEAQRRLEDMGYDPEDAWLYLSQSVHAELPRRPEPGITREPTEGAEVETLSAAQVARALQNGLIDQAEAMARLAVMGYRPHEAWLYLSNQLKVELPDEPPADT